MVREALTASRCRAGVQLGDVVWRQYCVDGKNPDTLDDGSARCFFEETNGGFLVPRNLSVDSEPNVIDDIRNGDLFRSQFLLQGKEGATVARGHYTVGKEIIDKVNDRMKKLMDNCANVQGFVVNHSVGADTGLGALISERMAVDYRKNQN